MSISDTHRMKKGIKDNDMIGIYDYTVILTYTGFLCALIGMIQASSGSFFNAVLFMGVALFCDTFDGKVARAKRNRTRKEALFGINIDSLCDLVSFGIFPAYLCYCMGLRDAIGLFVLAYYCLCCVIRLSYFNVLAIESEQSGYRGIPVVGFSILLPAIFLIRLWFSEDVFLWALRVIVPVIATFYILDIPIKKPKLTTLAGLLLVYCVPLVIIGLKG